MDPRESFRQDAPLRVLDQLRLAIRTGWPARAKFDEFTLRSELGASRTAVREALQQLAAEGLVSREASRGTVLSGSIRLIPVAEHDGAGEDAVLIDTIDSHRVPSTAYLREMLSTDATTLVCTRHLFTSPRLPGPIGVRTSYHRVEVERPVRRQAPVGVLAETFAEVFGAALSDVQSRFSAERASLEVARALRVPQGTVVLTREQRLSSTRGRVEELSFGHFRSDRVAFTEGGGSDASPRPEPLY
jgi:GntR family transcriptional regulator